MSQNSKFGAIVMGVLTLVYVGLLSNTGFTLLGINEPVAKIMGALILVFPIFALWLTIREFIFGIQVERLASQIEAAGNWPHFDFELRPSGRPTRESADRVFASFAKAAEQNPTDSTAWFSLGLAYDAAGDRSRARAAMRKALALSRTKA
jgi:tetratricopeptide (TPR) repeat protein